MMKTFFLLLFSLCFVQFGFSNEKLYYIQGKVLDIEIAGDDISFYTWSVYLDVKLPMKLSEYGFDKKLKIDPETIEKLDQEHPDNIHKFGCGGHHSEAAAKKFVRSVRLSKNACFEIEESHLIRYLRDNAYKFEIEVIWPKKKCA